MCFVITAPHGSAVVALLYVVQSRVIVEEEEKLNLEIEHLNENTVLGQVHEEGLLSAVMA